MGAAIGQEVAQPVEAQTEGRGQPGMACHRHAVQGVLKAQREADHQQRRADAFERLITDPALERRMAKAARGRFDREFDIRVTERKLHERVAGLVQRVGKAR